MSKIGKIVELLIDWDEMEFEDLGVSIMSLVEKPAIGISWQAFADEQNFRENAECPDGFEHQMPDGSYMCGKEHTYEETDEIILMASAPDFGEVLDYANTIEISESQANFSELTDVLQGIIGLDILGRKDPTEEGEIKYRYSGPSPQRIFCRSLMRLNKVYTREELDQMDSFNPGFGPRGSNTYDIFKYKGGPNCQHYWEQVRVFREGRRTVVVNEGRAEGLAAIPMEDQANSGYLMSQWNFSHDDQMIITGPAMTPNVMIPRKDEQGNDFHVYFTRDTIEKISKKFLADSNHNNTDINHNDDVVTENTLLESWIVEDPDMDKSRTYGFDVPKGTWMISMKINNEDTWKQIKNKELNGYSITGQFIERATKK
tara:strand:+ start:6636 stop:7751 length:1116 start_codon:yes stop_codon:yes gene_type:complete